MKNKLRQALGFTVAAAAFASSAFALEVSPLNQTLEIKNKNYPSHSELKTIKRSDLNTYIIEFHQEPIALYKGEAIELNGEQISFASTSPSVTGKKVYQNKKIVNAYGDFLMQQQASFISSAKKLAPNMQVTKRFNHAINGMAVKMTEAEAQKLKADKSVKAVYPEVMYHINMDASLDLIGAKTVWDNLGGLANAGAGVRVAIVDSGITPEHPMFDDAGFTKPTEGMPTDDYCSTVDATFCNNKLIVARFAEPTFEVYAEEYANSPRDFGGHGTHVAGTAAGSQVSITYEGVDIDVSGVAPGAYIMAYKGLFTPASNPSGGSGSNVMLTQALEWAIADGADVINNSWGGSAGMDPALSPYRTIFESAEAAGIVIATSAGNSGSGAQTIGCPGCIEAGITVANTTHGRFFAKGITLAGVANILAIEGTSPVRLDADIVDQRLIHSADVDAANVEGCDAFPADSFLGAIAFISRGGCGFSDKSANAEAAGAIAMVVYNNRAGQPIVMGGMEAATIPSVKISQTDGQAVIAAMTGGDNGTLLTVTQRLVVAEFADDVAASSSRGPNGDGNILKPDLAAPGSSILSAYSPDQGVGDYATLSGTSMASPHVAGVAAVLKGANPDWNAYEIKTALTSTSLDDLDKEDSVTEADPFDIGAGRVQMVAAMDATIAFDKPSIANNLCVGNCTFSRTVNSLTDSATEWDIAVEIEGGVVATLSTNEAALAARGSEGESLTFNIDLNTEFATQDEWIFGKVVLTDQNGTAPTAHMPIAVWPTRTENTAFNVNLREIDEVTYEVSATYSNLVDADPISLTAQIPEGYKVSLGTEQVSLTNGEVVTDVTVTDTVSTSVRLGQANIEFTPGSSIGIDLSLQGFGEELIACDDGCDEFSSELNIGGFGGFNYLGTNYGVITVSDNGFVALGSAETAGSYNNQTFPNPNTPNAVLAPFWTDFDLKDPADADDTGTGEIYYGLYCGNAECNVILLGLQWNNVSPWVSGGTAAETYTFQQWFILGTDVSWFEYPALNETLPGALTVGAENGSGTLGTNYFVNGVGTAPATGDVLDMTTTTGGAATLSFNIHPVVNNDLEVTMEEDSQLVVDIVEEDSFTVNNIIASATVVAPSTTASAYNSLMAEGEYNLVDVKSESVENMTASVADDMLSLTPAADFNGTVLVTSQVVFESRNSGELVEVPQYTTVNVEGINDAPVAMFIDGTLASANGGETITLDATASYDIDGDAISFEFTQTAGYVSAITNNGDGTATIVLANTFDGEVYSSFAVTVTDSEGLSASAETSIAVTGTATSSANQAPEVQVTAPNETEKGESIVIDATGTTDPEGDEMTFTFNQTAGYEAEITNNGDGTANVQFSDDFDGNVYHTIMVTATDANGATASAPVTVLVSDEDDDDTEGGAPWLVLLLGLPMLLRNRRA